MNNGKVFEQLMFVEWMKEKHSSITLNSWQLLFIGIYFQNRLRGEDFLSHCPDAVGRDYIADLLHRFMEDNGIPKQLTAREKFAEHISSLHKINASKHCSTCDDSLVLGFKIEKDGSEVLVKCQCAAYGTTEYNRLFDAMIDMEKNLAGVILSARERSERWFTATNTTMVKNFDTMAGNMDLLDKGIKLTFQNTFWGGIKVVIMAILEKINQILYAKPDSEKQKDELKLINPEKAGE